MALQTPTNQTIRTRIEAMLDEIPEVVTILTNQETAPLVAQLPAVRVYAGRAERSRELSRQNRMVTRDWYITVMMNRIGGDTNEKWTAAQKRSAEIAAEQWLELIPDWFARYANLTLASTKKQLTGVKRVDEPRDNGLQTITYGSPPVVYFGAVYELPITILRA